MPEPPRNTSVDALLGQAQEAIGKASYTTALELLRRAAVLAPDNTEVRQLLAQTEQASRRHQAAVTRHQTVLRKARQIYDLLERDDLEAAREQLREAGVEHGKHEALTALEERLASQQQVAIGRRAAAHALSARKYYEAGDLRAALEDARRSLRLVDAKEVRELRDRIRTELGRQAEDRHYREAIEEARDDVERLIAARELPRADHRLQQAIDQLGHDESFEELRRRIDKAKYDQRFRQRVEWAERRAREAERLSAEADRLSLQGAHGRAVEQLENALDLDSSHPDLEAKLEAARAALDRQLAEQRHIEAVDARVAEITAHLDALRLDDADTAIRAAIEELGEPHRFVTLGTRLERLREAERGSPQAAPVDSAADGGESDTSALRRQRILAAAYSWKQALLYPLRGLGLQTGGILLGTLLVLDFLALIPPLGTTLRVLSALVLFAALGLFPPIVRATLAGRNLLPAWAELANARRWALDLLRMAGLVALACLPLLLWLATRGWHGALGAESLPFGWLLAALLGWLAAAFLVTASGATEAFGGRQMLRLERHGRSLAATDGDGLLIAGGVFAGVLLLVLLRATAVPSAPWLFGPFVRAIEVYALLAVPHLVGVVVRRHRVELARIYG